MELFIIDKRLSHTNKRVMQCQYVHGYRYTEIAKNLDKCLVNKFEVLKFKYNFFAFASNATNRSTWQKKKLKDNLERMSYLHSRSTLNEALFKIGLFFRWYLDVAVFLASSRGYHLTVGYQGTYSYMSAICLNGRFLILLPSGYIFYIWNTEINNFYVKKLLNIPINIYLCDYSWYGLFNSHLYDIAGLGKIILGKIIFG